jgi:hypothetical protein
MNEDKEGTISILYDHYYKLSDNILEKYKEITGNNFNQYSTNNRHDEVMIYLYFLNKDTESKLLKIVEIPKNLRIII